MKRSWYPVYRTSTDACFVFIKNSKERHGTFTQAKVGAVSGETPGAVEGFEP